MPIRVPDIDGRRADMGQTLLLIGAVAPMVVLAAQWTFAEKSKKRKSEVDSEFSDGGNLVFDRDPVLAALEKSNQRLAVLTRDASWALCRGFPQASAIASTMHELARASSISERIDSRSDDRSAEVRVAEVCESVFAWA